MTCGLLVHSPYSVLFTVLYDALYSRLTSGLVFGAAVFVFYTIYILVHNKILGWRL